MANFDGVQARRCAPLSLSRVLISRGHELFDLAHAHTTDTQHTKGLYGQVLSSQLHTRTTIYQSHPAHLFCAIEMGAY